MDEAELHLTNDFLEEKKTNLRLPTGTFHFLHNYVTTKYNLHKTSLSITADTILGNPNMEQLH